MKLVKDFVLPTAVLTIICLVVSAALSVTYGITNPIIEENSRRQAQEALMEVLPEADSFTETTDALPEGVLKLYTAQNGVGKVVQTSVSGYGGAVVVMTGVKTDGTVSGVKVLQNSETQGLGSRVMGSEYTAQFFGVSDPEQVESISGSTVSSNALKNSIRLAIETSQSGKE
ncbi:MAG: FMN-binding protein [Clostridiales bacterium]|uniref:Ion-translocating oxidoreductase complex subunit G n=1 Tax=Harryflintia acetispora TaxID=1849041 RepID=A0A9X8UKV6_9FIRM|nr:MULTISPECIES: FMN-binding protein [Oscillospiraceae]PWM39243.1 MAG: FMN-binding protein [Clostridiales bacterium]RGB69822.1 FMN-binding protein [Harryflintia acetispora]TCL44662.1 electron transport complex protein RnfG [Harryflintia acetispora]